MGEAKRKQYSREVFLQQHPKCCYCGASSTTTDHCPPRSLFEQRHWPEGYEFPACQPCNLAGRKQEQIISTIFSFSLRGSDATASAGTSRKIQELHNNQPDVLREWKLLNRNETRHNFREDFGRDLGNEFSRRGFGLAEFGPLTHAALDAFGEKIAKALFYLHTGKRADGPVRSTLVSQITQRNMVFEGLDQMPIFAQIKRANRQLNEQFGYRYNVSPELGALIAAPGFREQFGYVVFAFSQSAYEGLVAHNPSARAIIEGWNDRFRHMR